MYINYKQIYIDGSIYTTGQGNLDSMIISYRKNLYTLKHSEVPCGVYIYIVTCLAGGRRY